MAHNKSWKQEEDRALMDLINNVELDYVQTADKLERTPQSIAARVCRLRKQGFYIQPVKRIRRDTGVRQRHNDVEADNPFAPSAPLFVLILVAVLTVLAVQYAR